MKATNVDQKKDEAGENKENLTEIKNDNVE